MLEPWPGQVLRARRYHAWRGKEASPISPIALEAVKRIDAVFDIEREINGFSAEDRLAARRLKSAPLVAALEEWMRAERAKLSRHNAVAQAIDYMLTRWPAFTRFLEDGRICLTNNAAKRALRGLALGRKSWLFAGSQRGAERAGQRPDPWKAIHPRRAPTSQTGSLHARPQRHPIEPRIQGQIRSHGQSRKTRQGRHRGDHEKAPHPRQRPHPRPAKMGPR
jgi:hypothetical protein